jgi:hypothetical protein
MTSAKSSAILLAFLTFSAALPGSLQDSNAHSDKKFCVVNGQHGANARGNDVR